MNSQNTNTVSAQFDMVNKTIKVNQVIQYQNKTTDTLSIIYLTDWNHSYSTKTTPLATRFSEEYSTKFHFATSDQRGYTNMITIKDPINTELNYNRLLYHPDIIEVRLNQPLEPNASYTVELIYNLKIPDDNFTSYGIDKQGDINFKYWYITPVVYDGKWNYYSNKNLDDLYSPNSDIQLELEVPLNYIAISELDPVHTTRKDSTQIFSLFGKDRNDHKLVLTKYSNFKYVKTDDFAVLSDIDTEGIAGIDKAMITDKITQFLTNHLGKYPHKTLMVTQTEYSKDPLYGINQLPSFIRPFPGNLQYELKVLKTALKNYLDQLLPMNPREDYWLKDGLQTYLLMSYIEEHYPDLKLMGSLSKIWGLRSFHAAKVDFNEQYNLFYMQMARTNRDQPLSMSKDSLLKFNAMIANKYKAGIGLEYLKDYLTDTDFDAVIKSFISDQQSAAIVTSEDFRAFLNSKTNKNIDWFFEDYVQSRTKIDYKIKSVKTTKDSIHFTLINKRHNHMPISVFTLRNDSVKSKYWIENVDDLKHLSIPKTDANKLVLNYDNKVPEFNLRDNWKHLDGRILNNKPFQLRVFKDIEDPYYNQVFVMPLLEFNNIYDGFTLGARFYNKTLLNKAFNYHLIPKYGLKSKILTGSASAFYQINIENQDLYNINLGMFGSHESFAKDAFVSIFSPSIGFNFRDDSDFRSNKRAQLNFRYLNISRTLGEHAIVELNEPNYSVFNLRYIHANPGLINYSKLNLDLQASKTFGKFSVNYEYRKLSERNRQFNLRLFAGTFLYNSTDPSSDYFSFALDRPTDYLFDYKYLGRSESSGIFSQQIIIADGGFKSKLSPAFANMWMTTANTSTTAWRYIEAYGDIGLVKNKYESPQFVYDSGIRVNLVTDYFEIYFPVYSNLGWEVSQPNYSEKIRFKFTASPEALLGLFRRKWF